MIWKVILWASMSWLPILMYITHRNETRFKKNMVVEVTLPYQARTDQAVLDILDRFKRQILWLNLALFLITIPLLWINKMSLVMGLFMTWILLAIALPMIPYVRTNLALKRLKQERGWKRGHEEVRYVNLSSLPPTNWISPWAFIPGIIITFLPMIWDREMYPLYLISGITAIFFWFGYRYLYRNKSEMVDQNIELTRVLTQVRRHNWGKVWLISVYCFAAMSLIFYIFKYQPMIQLIATLLLSFIMTVVAIRVEFRTRRVQETLTAESGKNWYVDEDDYWLGGVVYYNPNDSRLLINSRVGVNTTFNLAKTSGKVLAGLVVLLLLAMPFTGVFLSALEQQPITLELTEESLIALRGRNQILIERSAISQIELLSELPDKMIRIGGNALDHQLSGKFSAPDIGSMRLSLDPTMPPYLLVTLEDGTKYLIGSREQGQSETIYRRLNR